MKTMWKGHVLMELIKPAACFIFFGETLEQTSSY